MLDCLRISSTLSEASFLIFQSVCLNIGYNFVVSSFEISARGSKSSNPPPPPPAAPFLPPAAGISSAASPLKPLFF